MSFVKELKDKNKTASNYEKLGFAVECMLMNDNYSLYHVRTLQFWTKEAISHDQFKLFFNNADDPLGYMTWAYLRDDTLSRLQNDPLFLLHTSEWDENGTLCILDFCCRPGSAPYCMAYMKTVPPISNASKVVWRSRKSGKLISRVNRALIPMNEISIQGALLNKSNFPRETGSDRSQP